MSQMTTSDSVLKLKELFKRHDQNETSLNWLDDIASHTTRASVLIPLFYKEGELHVILTKRSSDLTHHAGYVAFPGGKKDDTDKDDIETALRESEEEIGLKASDVEVIAVLSPSFVRPNTIVTPVIGIVSPDFVPVKNEREVAFVFDLPLERFLSDERRHTTDLIMGRLAPDNYTTIENTHVMVMGSSPAQRVGVSVNMLKQHKFRQNLSNMSSKAKCKYWEKCYRKEATHLSDFLHPADVKENKKESKKEEKEETVIKPSLRRGKTHELSFVDEPSTDVKKKKEEKKEADKEMDTSEAKPVATAATGKRREKCKYWGKCYRKDAGHKKLYVHPGDPDEKTAVEPGRTRSSTRPKPLNHMDSVDSVELGGFTLKRTGSNYECTCGSFSGAKNFGKASNQKTCSHLKKYLGEEFEIARCNLPQKGKKEHIPSHINISVLLAHKYQDGVTNPTGWWMSEKLDGVRAYWNGKCFYSRLGNAFFAPSWFTQDLPRHMHLDGELFGGRKKFQSTVSIVKTPGHALWNKVSYNVFDAPHMEKEPFEKRMKAVQEYFEKAKPQYAKFVEHVKCTGTDQVDKELKRIIALGGEGLMIRQPGSKYERTRSKTLLKIKKFHDAEAVVVGHEPSKSNPGLTGALWVKMACGKKFKVGSGLSNKDRRSPPKKGTIITYKFQEYTNSGTPRFPTFVGIRIDMSEPKDAEGVVTTAVDDP